jgi:glycosyltransferase involved in cell wall biosynthesis
MRVCYVAFQFWPSVGGSQSQAEKQARYLRQLGQEVLVVTLRHQKVWPARETYATFPVVRVGGWYRRGGILRAGRFGHLWVDLALFLTLWRLRRSYDLIHTLQLSPLAVVATFIGKLTHKPVIIGIQSTGPYERVPDSPLQEVSVETSSRAKDAIGPHVVSMQVETGGDIAGLQRTNWGGQWMLNYLRKSNAYYQILSSRSYLYLMQHNFRPERIIYIPNGVDIQQFYPLGWACPEKMTRREERLLLCVARLEYAKGVDVLLRAWAHMMAMPPAWRYGLRPRLCLAGDGTCREELEQLAVALEIQESVEFYGTCRDIPHILRESWGFVLPSRWEGMPNALLEAMACALPCIATRVSGSEDLIEQGINGLLVEPEQPEQLAYALRLLIEDAGLARQLGWQGYETVLRYYQLGSTVQNCLALYRYLLARDAAHRRPTGPLQDDFSPQEWQRQ